MSKTSRRVAPAEAAHRQVLPDREPGEDRVFLRDVAEAKPHAPLGGHPRDVLPVEASGAARRGQLAHDGLQQRRLADAVAAQNRHRAGRGHVKGHVEEHLAPPVRGAQAIHMEQAVVRHE